jgi:hypothetical protein
MLMLVGISLLVLGFLGFGTLQHDFSVYMPTSVVLRFVDSSAPDTFLPPLLDISESFSACLMVMDDNHNFCVRTSEQHLLSVVSFT